MKALVWHGKSDVRCDTVPDPTIEDPHDVIVKITSTAICGSDLHLYDGYMPMMEDGDILGHEPLGAFMNKGLTMKTGQTHVKRYSEKLLGMIDAGEIEPSFVITHSRPLAEGPEMYKTFRDKQDGCIKVVLKP